MVAAYQAVGAAGRFSAVAAPGPTLAVNKDMQQLVQLAEAAGWTVTLTSKNHYRFKAPGGEWFSGRSRLQIAGR